MIKLHNHWKSLPYSSSRLCLLQSHPVSKIFTVGNLRNVFESPNSLLYQKAEHLSVD